LLPIPEFPGAESVTAKVSFVHFGYFFFGDLEKMLTIILLYQALGQVKKDFSVMGDIVQSMHKVF
jgi:hypothetical protein